MEEESTEKLIFVVSHKQTMANPRTPYTKHLSTYKVYLSAVTTGTYFFIYIVKFFKVHGTNTEKAIFSIIQTMSSAYNCPFLTSNHHRFTAIIQVDLH